MSMLNQCRLKVPTLTSSGKSAYVKLVHDSCVMFTNLRLTVLLLNYYCANLVQAKNSYVKLVQVISAYNKLAQVNMPMLN
jgi:hypothetical protein